MHKDYYHMRIDEKFETGLAILHLDEINWKTGCPMANVKSTLEDENFDFVEAFRISAEEVAERMSRYGLTVRPYQNATLPHYKSLSTEQQRRSLKNLSVYLQSIKLTEANGDRFDDSGRSLWHALSALGFVPPSDLFAKLPPGVAVEIYDTDGIQVWRNWETMRVCSYTLEEIHTMEWHRRYERDERINALCFQVISDILEGRVSEVYDPKIPTHALLETCSMEGFLLDVQFEFLARLKDRQGQPAAFLLAATVKSAKKTRALDLGPALRPVEVDL